MLVSLTIGFTWARTRGAPLLWHRTRKERAGGLSPPWIRACEDYLSGKVLVGQLQKLSDSCWMGIYHLRYIVMIND